MSTIDSNTLISTIQSIHLFNQLEDKEIIALSAISERKEYATGEVIIEEGGRPPGLFLIHDGTVEVRKKAGDEGEKVIATLNAPSFFGEMGLITGQKTSAEVVAKRETVCFLIHKLSFDRMLASESLAAYKMVSAIAHMLAGRLKKMDEELVRLSSERSEAVELLSRLKSNLFDLPK